MHKTKIDWADCSWNPVTGCLQGCSYCYPKKQSARFSGDVRLNILDERCSHANNSEDLFILEKPFVTRNQRSIAYPFGFSPTLHKYRLDTLSSWKTGANIFVCSMADLFGEWVPDEWIDLVFEACAKYPQHNYLFLTKNPARYMTLANQNKLPNSDNMWYGTTITDETQPYFSATQYKCFLSIEPIASNFASKRDFHTANMIDWIIIGAETGNRKGKITPAKDWITNFSELCKKENIPLFMKDSLSVLMGQCFSQKMPIHLTKEKRMSEKKQQKLMSNCMECNQPMRKAEMVSVTLRKGRSGKNKTIGFVCEGCLAALLKKWMVK